MRYVQSAVVAQDQMLGIGRIDPQGMMIAVHVFGGRLKLDATVRRGEKADAEYIDTLSIRRIDANLAIVKRPRTQRVDMSPGSPFVVAAEYAAVVERQLFVRRCSCRRDRRLACLDDGINNVRVLWENGDAAPA